MTSTRSTTTFLSDGFKWIQKEFHQIVENVVLISSFIFVLSLVVGICFYMWINNWSFPLAYYFAASVLLGDMYLIPTEPNSISQVFTLFYFLWGTTLLAGAVAAAANTFINNAGNVASEERKKILKLQNTMSRRENPEISDDVNFFKLQFTNFLNYISWLEYRSKYIAILMLFCWLLIGVVFCLYYEEWDLAHSFNFSLAAISASGSFPPTCDPLDPLSGDEDNCDLGVTRSMFLGTYIITGVPVFAYTMGQFAELLVEQAIRAHERQMMLRPLTADEFRFALELQKGTVLEDSDEEHENDDVSKESDSSASFNRQGSSLYSTPSLSRAGSSSTTRRMKSVNDSQHPVSLMNSFSVHGRQKSISEEDAELPGIPKKQQTANRSKSSSNLRKKSHSKNGVYDFQLDLGYFIILELLRIQKITKSDLLSIKELFDRLDEDRDGKLTKTKTMNKVPTIPKSFPHSYQNQQPESTMRTNYESFGSSSSTTLPNFDRNMKSSSLPHYHHLESIPEELSFHKKPSNTSSTESPASLTMHRQKSTDSEAKRTNPFGENDEDEETPTIVDEIPTPRSDLSEEKEGMEPNEEEIELPPQLSAVKQPSLIFRTQSYVRNERDPKKLPEFNEETLEISEEAEEEEEEIYEGKGDDEDEEEGGGHNHLHKSLTDQYNDRIVNMMQGYVERFHAKHIPGESGKEIVHDDDEHDEQSESTGLLRRLKSTINQSEEGNDTQFLGNFFKSFSLTTKKK